MSHDDQVKVKLKFELLIYFVLNYFKRPNFIQRLNYISHKHQLHVNKVHLCSVSWGVSFVCFWHLNLSVFLLQFTLFRKVTYMLLS